MPHVFSASDPEVKHGKPAPDLFKNAAKIMGFHPAQCIVVEDSIAGVEAGVAASMFTIGFIGGGALQHWAWGQTSLSWRPRNH